MPACVKKKNNNQKRETHTKKQLFTLGSNITPAHGNNKKKPAERTSAQSEGEEKTAFV